MQSIERNSSPVPVFTNEQLRAYHSLENLINEQSGDSNNSPCTIIPPTPLNERLLVLTPSNFDQICQPHRDCEIQNKSNQSILSEIISNQNLNSKLNDDVDLDRSESSVFDSDVDPEYIPPESNERMIDLLRDDSPCCSKTLTRKRVRHPETWKKNQRKAKCQRGEQFTNDFGVTRKSRQIKVGCGENCSYDCSNAFNSAERKIIFDNFWSLNAKSKGEFFGKMVYRVAVERKRTKNPNSRRKNTYHFHFLKSDKLTRVCQVFFTNTLDINKSRVHYYFDHLVDSQTKTSKSPSKGKHVKNALPDNKLAEVASHINSFATMDSHYCRSSTNKKYLEPHLNLKTMYNLYCNDYDDPVKYWAYKHVFDTQFNLAFYVPKKDLCNRCEEHKIKAQNGVTITEEEENEISRHLENKLRARTEKDMDKINVEANTRILIIDLQNVFTLPKANINCFYYKRKLLCYNLTGFCKDNKTTYCSIWNETSQGRGANELASAYIKILKAVITDFPETEKIIIWSDSCVAQNRNSILSFSLLKFIKEHPAVSIIEQKYSEPGHSLLQEIDAVHSTLERYLKNKEIYSPIGLIRLLLNAKFPKVYLKVIQMKDTDFYNYSKAAQKFVFSNIPYTKVKQLSYTARNITNIKYKTSFNNDFSVESIDKPVSSRRTRKNAEEVPSENKFEVTLCQKENLRLSEEKRKDLMSLLKFMPQADQNFYKAILQ